MASNFPSSNDVFTEPGAPTTTTLNSAGTGSRNHFQHHTDLGDAVEAIQASVPLLNHDHSGSGPRPTNKLAQVNTHQSPDTDASPASLHHTLGTGANQAAAGNHGHAVSGITGLQAFMDATRTRLYGGSARTYSPICEVRFTAVASFSVPANADIAAASGWFAQVDPENIFHPYDGVNLNSYIQVPITGRYRVFYHCSWELSNGGFASSRILKNSLSNDQAIASDKILLDDVKEYSPQTVTDTVALTGGDKLYWLNWSDVAARVYGKSFEIPTKIVVEWIGPN